MATERPLIDYDARRRRLWIAGQRVHHGLTGLLVAAGGLGALALRPAGARRGSLELTLLGGALMAHDWKDRSLWLRAGHQHQP